MASVYRLQWCVLSLMFGIAQLAISSIYHSISCMCIINIPFCVFANVNDYHSVIRDVSGLRPPSVQRVKLWRHITHNLPWISRRTRGFVQRADDICQPSCIAWVLNVFATCLRVLSLLQVVDEIAETPSKRMRNKIAGFVTVITSCWCKAMDPNNYL